MINLAGYKITEQISKGGYYTVFRGIRESDNTPVVIKLLVKDYPSAKEITDFKHEYQIMSRVGSDGIVKAYDFVAGNRYAIIMEDMGGDFLAEGIKRLTLSVGEKIMLAIKMATSLARLHEHNIIHKAINPRNFIWNHITGELKLVDFCYSTEAGIESTQFMNLNRIEGSLPYISPEQTGRISRPLDHRTDLYSLGVCLYEIFTGTLPFQSEDKSELIYYHIAKIPQAPHEANPEVPQFISDLIMKLLSKAPEERYQTAIGLKRDLEFCLNNYDALMFGFISFVPGQGDVSDRFDIPRRLYGREAEVETLISAFERISEGAMELLLVSGPSGIGKSKLIHEVYKPITARKGYFVSGKFSQLTLSSPYYGISQALRELIRHLLSEPQERLDYLKHSLLHALGSNGQLIIDIIPELEMIIGPQPPVPDLSPLEAQNRFKITFREFFKALADPGYPLVLFLDDLQWSDASSLDLIEYLFESGDIRYVFIIGAYRDGEAENIEPLLRRLERLSGERQGAGTRFRQILLKALYFSPINQLVADTLHTGTEESKPLSRIIQRKTDGNPLFIRQMLKTLYLRRAITFVPERGCWTYDIQKVESAEISDNVVDLLVKSLSTLPEQTKKLLSIAAGIGSQFDLSTLSHISKVSPEKLAKALWVAIEKEIIIPLDSNYRYINTLKDETVFKSLEMRFGFAHDRIRQAIYSVIPEGEKSVLHYEIGLSLLDYYRETGRADVIFDLVNHLNKGRAHIKRKNERLELSELNIEAGKRAIKSTSFTTALSYFEAAAEALSEREWAAMPVKHFTLLLEQASAALLSGDFRKAEALCGKLDGMAEDSLQKCSVSNVRVPLYVFQGRLSDTIDEVRRALRLLGIDLPETAGEIEQKTKEGIEKIRRFISHTPVEEIVNFPVMTDPEKIMAVQLLFQVAPPAIQVSPELFNLVTIMTFDLTLTYGTSPLSCKAIGDCGVIMGTAFSDYKTGYRLGEVAFALINKFKAESQKPAVYFIFSFLSAWVKHYQEALDYYDLSYRSGMETGDLLHATYALAHKLHMLMWVGRSLNECRNEAEDFISSFNRIVMASSSLLLCEIILYFIDKLCLSPEEHPDFEERDRALIAKIEGTKNLVFLGRFYQYNTYVNFILGNYEEAEKWNKLADNILYAGQTDFPIPDHFLFKGLLLVRRWRKTPPDERSQIEDTLNGILSQLKARAEDCPENFAHKYYLLSAEAAVIRSEPLETITGLYKAAEDSIGAGDFVQFKALIKELCGRFWLGRGYGTVAKAYLREAYYLYEQWGAARKLALMDKEWDLHGGWEPSQRSGEAMKAMANLIDISSIIKCTQAISGEIKIENLLTTLMGILIENAGAQHGCILLRNEFDGKFYVEACNEVESGQNQVLPSLPLYIGGNICFEIVNYVIRTGETLVIRDASSDPVWQVNPYVRENQTRSVMCTPILHQNRIKGIVYLENNLSDGVFTASRLETIKILASQAAISIENARLYENMEEKVRERTSQLNAVNEKLKKLSLRDSLTGLYNRRYLYGTVSERVSAYINAHTRMCPDGSRGLIEGAKPIGVFLIDIDYFKDVNDTYGHAVGDSVLISIANVLKDMLTPADVIIRWGGEEFLIVLFNRSPEEYRDFARRVVEDIKSTAVKVSEDKVIYKTCSVGYCEIPLDPNAPDLITLEQTIRISDYALYCAKEKGRNCSVRFSLKCAGLDDEALRSLKSLSKLDFNEDYFEVEYL